MDYILPLIIATVAGLSTLIGALFIFVKIPKKKINQFISLSLSISIAIMIIISVTELMPEGFLSLTSTYGLFLGIIYTVILFIIGSIIILGIDKYVSIKGESSLYKLGFLNMIALMAHNFPEGIATYMSSYHNLSLGIKLAASIILHNIPEGMAIAIPIFYATKSRGKAFKYAFYAGVAEPLGALLTMLFFHNYINELSISVILIIVAGIMISLAIHKILEEVMYYQEKKWIIRGFIVGAVICFIGEVFI